MKKIGLLLLGALVLTACPVGAVICTTNPPTPPTPGNSNSMMSGPAYHAVKNAQQLKEKAHSLLDQAMEQDLDVSEIEDIIAKADALLEMAEKIKKANPIPANNMAREAAELYEQAISDLEALLG
ncbi:MAG: hypothetical protein HXS46_01325 [Theionarchaea archaeon]|nr:MAG: hypothetical protein AYK18_01885 [Theionarchaea archaeon DG-70]MBU7009302.1 hypothetical protein [Theionarchaea archaeon]